MARIVFTQNIQRHVECPAQSVPGATVREVLDNAFAGNPRARTLKRDTIGAAFELFLRLLTGFAPHRLQAIAQLDAVFRAVETVHKS